MLLMDTIYNPHSQPKFSIHALLLHESLFLTRNHESKHAPNCSSFWNLLSERQRRELCFSWHALLVSVFEFGIGNGNGTALFFTAFRDCFYFKKKLTLALACTFLVGTIWWKLNWSRAFWKRRLMWLSARYFRWGDTKLKLNCFQTSWPCIQRWQ